MPWISEHAGRPVHWPGWLARLRWTPGWPRHGLRPLGSHVVGRGMVLHAVQWGDEELLLGCTERRITVLARRAAPAGGPEPRA